MSDNLDEYLSAYLDGALPPGEAAAFAARLDAEPALAARADALRANDRFMAAAFAPLASAPIDDAMLVRLGLAAGAEPASAPPPAANDNSHWWRRRGLALAGGAVAAAFAAVLVLVGRPQAPADGGFTVALDTTPSLKVAKLADGTTIEPRLTVRAADGRWCREYRRGDSEALACRDNDRWQEIGHGSAPRRDSGQGQVILASGEDDASLTRSYRQIGASDPLDAAQEAKLIADGWSSKGQ